MKQIKRTPIDQLQRYMRDEKTGLTAEDIALRKSQGYGNAVRTKAGKSYAAIFAGNMLTFFNLLGILVFALMIAIGSFENAFFFIVILANLAIGIFQEIRAKKSIEKLSLLSAPVVTVVRGGQQTEIAVSDVVLDDVVLLSSGRQIVADAIVISGEVEVNESLLTGESEPIRKKQGDMLLSGSFIVSGSCFARVEHVGADNYVETLSAQAKAYHKPKSELMRSINLIIKAIAVVIFPLAIATFLMTLHRYGGTSQPNVDTFLLGSLPESVVESLKKSATSAIGMVPSGMVLLTSAALAVSVIRLAGRKTLVQDLYCIEMLARVNVLCLDKTGTITDGTMKVEDVVVLDEVGFDIHAVMGDYCRVMQGDNQSAVAMRNKFGTSQTMTETKVLSFSSARKLAAASFDGFGTLIVGAPEFVMKLDKKCEEKISQYTSQGKRVVLAAFSKDSMNEDLQLPKNLKAAALIVIEDTIRDDAAEIIKWFKDNRVDVKIISGDNAETVSVIAGKVGVDNAERYISLDGLSDEEVVKVAMEYTVFGRVKPNQKALLVETLKSHGKTVAMTGDGVNDILAMKKADCAIAIAAGSEAARSVAHLVLMDSKFSAMPQVVREGRKVVNNIQNSSSLFLMKTIMTMLVTIMVLIWQNPYPFEPRHLYLIEFFVIGMPSFVLALRHNDKLIEGRFLTNTLVRAIPSGLALALSVMLVLWVFGVTDKLSAMEIATLATISLTYSGIIALTVLCYPYRKLEILTIALSLIVVTLAFILSFAQKLLGITTTLDNLWIVWVCAALSLVVILVPRFVKRFVRERRKNKAEAETAI